MSVPRLFGGHQVFDDAGPASARRVFIDAADGWLGRRVGLEIARGGGVSEAAVRGVLGDARTTANAINYAARHGLTLEQAALSSDVARLSLNLRTARANKDWGALRDGLEELYNTELPNVDHYVEGE